MVRLEGRIVPLEKGALIALLRRPALWPTALVELRALARPRWWSKWPPLPLPASGYMRFRLEAMYGTSRGKLSAAELVGYLEWCRWMRALAR
jgi:hypothetical protein